MPKVIGPLFSAAASGKFADVTEFRRVGSETIACKPRTAAKERSPNQQAQSSRFQTAAQEWSKLVEAQQDQWKDAAAAMPINGYQLYIQEYLNQGCTPPAQPVRPV